MKFLIVNKYIRTQASADGMPVSCFLMGWVGNNAIRCENVGIINRFSHLIKHIAHGNNFVEYIAIAAVHHTVRCNECVEHCLCGIGACGKDRAT